MKTWQKILVGFIGSGLSGGLTYTASLVPTWAVPLGLFSLAIVATMSVLIGWPPKNSA